MKTYSYKWSNDRFQVLQLQSLMRKQAVFEGTELERELLAKLNEKPDS